MVKDLITVSLVIALGMCAVWVGGCESDAQTGTLLGGAAGAGVGALAGGDTESTLIGAAVGAGAGYMLGNEGDKKKAAAERESIRQDMSYETVWVTNSNGSKIPVRLRKQGPNYIGPNGEYYEKLPTEEQLRKLYGY
jgi:hypothetical protein